MLVTRTWITSNIQVPTMSFWIRPGRPGRFVDEYRHFADENPSPLDGNMELFEDSLQK